MQLIILQIVEFDEDVVEERRLSFEIILREMADYHQVVINPSFRKFVEVPLNVNIFPSNFCINSYVSRRRTTITSPRGAPPTTTNTVTPNNASSSHLSDETSPTVTVISSQIEVNNNDQAVDQVVVEANQSTITLTSQPEEPQITTTNHDNEYTSTEVNNNNDNTCEESSGEANIYQEHSEIISQLSTTHLHTSHHYNSGNPRKSTDMPYYQLKMEAGSSKLLDMNPEERVQEILRQIKSETTI